jgi:ribose 5-phosphate isomerase B
MRIKIAIASDHAGYEYKEEIKSHLEAKGLNVTDFGTTSRERVDYIDFIRPASESVAQGESSLGIILGGSGNEAIVANRIKGIRCAVVWNEQTACLAKEHGDCNMISIGQRMMSKDEAIRCVDAWLSAEFKSGRHKKRIDRIDE